MLGSEMPAIPAMAAFNAAQPAPCRSSPLIRPRFPSIPTPHTHTPWRPIRGCAHLVLDELHILAGIARLGDGQRGVDVAPNHPTRHVLARHAWAAADCGVLAGKGNVIGRYAVPPPQLPADAPVTDVLQPAEPRRLVLLRGHVQDQGFRGRVAGVQLAQTGRHVGTQPGGVAFTCECGHADMQRCGHTVTWRRVHAAMCPCGHVVLNRS
eukprot:90662-Chlamydomonas_euryale.AAC.3